MSRLGEDVTRRLRGDVVTGCFPVGARLTEAALCERYGVSRAPVREALRALEGEGFVTARAYAGVSVASVDADDARDLFAVRETIETLVVERLARRFGGEGGSDWSVEAAARIDDVVRRGRGLVTTGGTGLPALNTEFHLTLAELAGSHSLLRLLRQVAGRIEWLYAMDVDVRGEHSWAEHAEIATAVVEGRCADATHAMRAHVHASRDGYLLRHAPA